MKATAAALLSDNEFMLAVAFLPRPLREAPSDAPARCSVTAPFTGAQDALTKRPYKTAVAFPVGEPTERQTKREKGKLFTV